MNREAILRDRIQDFNIALAVRGAFGYDDVMLQVEGRPFARIHEFTERAPTLYTPYNSTFHRAPHIAGRYALRSLAVVSRGSLDFLAANLEAAQGGYVFPVTPTLVNSVASAINRPELRVH